MRKASLILLLLLLLVGCSATQIGYRFADTFIKWEVQSYLKMSSSLEQQVDGALKELHHWHARNELPIYRDTLSQLRTQIADNNLSKEDIEAYYYDARSAWRRALTAAEPHVQEILLQLNARERSHLKTKFFERQREQLKSLAETSTAARKAELIKETESSLEKWLGEVTPEQQQLIVTWFEQRESVREDWVQYTSQLQAKLLSILDYAASDGPIDNALVQRQLQGLIVDPHRYRSMELQQKLKQNQMVTVSFVFELNRSLTPNQRARILAKVDGFIEDLDGIIAHYQR